MLDIGLMNEDIYYRIIVHTRQICKPGQSNVAIWTMHNEIQLLDLAFRMLIFDMATLNNKHRITDIKKRTTNIDHVYANIGHIVFGHRTRTSKHSRIPDTRS